MAEKNRQESVPEESKAVEPTEENQEKWKDKYYIMEGPATIGNIFGNYGHEVPAGKFVVVENGEYSNGGNGPSQAFKGVFDSKESAEKAIQDRETKEQLKK